ncbi:MAG: hypothetical protein WA622_17225 [Mycobacterium sp.]|uniref:hypothetical protein n=1 Tax=Mycobacterium sp. TaxID=1785 RepID=UPI003BB7383C
MKRREDSEPKWPAEFVEFDPEMWKSKYDWEVARIRWARARGFKQYKILPLLQAMVRTAPFGVEPSDQDDA